MADRSHLTIGEVLSLLREEFPDVSISKIRFLESQGLVDPERTPSGYRKFYDHDVERLRWILRQQRENFLPLKVIRGRLIGQEGEGALDLADTPGADGLEEAAAAPVPPPGLFDEPVAEPAPGPVGLWDPSATDGIDVAAPVAAGLADEFGPRDVEPAGDRSDPEEEVGRAPSWEPADSSASHVSPDSPVSPRSPARGDRAAPAEDSAPERAVSSEGAPALETAVASEDPASEDPASEDPASGESAAGDPAAQGAGVPEGPVVPDPAAPVPPGDSSGDTTNGAQVTRAPRPRRSRATAERRAQPDPTAPVPPDEPTPPRPAPSEAVAAGGGGNDAEAANGDGREPEVYTVAELAEAAGCNPQLVRELEQYGLLVAGSNLGGKLYFDADALVVARIGARFAELGVEPRHLRAWRIAADREASLFEQLVMPLLRQRNPQSRREAADRLEELSSLGGRLRSGLLAEAVRSIR
jgi:DNA-binding transcriptional MerR regulator